MGQKWNFSSDNHDKLKYYNLQIWPTNDTV